jgi:hypothetical protein
VKNSGPGCLFVIRLPLALAAEQAPPVYARQRG